MKPNSRAVIDCFLFFNELELLELRFRELSGVVDRFVLVESSTTFTGRPKPLVFRESQERFLGVMDRVTVVTVDDAPVQGDAWSAEHFQRNAIVRGLDHVKPSDLILISDVDEIPRASAVAAIRDTMEPVVLRDQSHYYWLNCRLSHVDYGPAALPARLLTTPQHVRAQRHRFQQIADGGWHFSYLGGSQRIQTKLQSFSHTEYSGHPFTDSARIDHCLQHAKDLFGRTDVGFPPTFVDLEVDDRYSHAVRSFAADHPELVYPVNERVLR